MSKDKIEVSMNVYDIPIVVEALEKADKEIERLKEIIEDYRNKEIIDFSHKLDESWYKEDYEKLNHRINKAIEYIKTLNEYGIGKQAKKELLEILKGSDKD